MNKGLGEETDEGSSRKWAIDGVGKEVGGRGNLEKLVIASAKKGMFGPMPVCVLRLKGRRGDREGKGGDLRYPTGDQWGEVKEIGQKQEHPQGRGGEPENTLGTKLDSGRETGGTGDFKPHYLGII